MRAVPDLRVIVRPLEAITVRGRSPLVIVDRLSQLPRADGSERGGDRPQVLHRPQIEMLGVVSGEPESWLQPGHLFDIRGLQWWDFRDPLTGARMAGFTLAEYRLPLYCYAENARNPLMALPDVEAYCLAWKVRHGDLWANVMPDDGEERMAIAWYSAAPPGATYTTEDGQQGQIVALPEDPARWDAGASYIIETRDAQPEYQSFAVKLWLGTPAPGVTPWLRISWAGRRYSLLLAQGLPPVLSVAHPGKSPYWRRADVAAEASGDWMPGELWVGVYAIAGRVVVRVWGGTADYTLCYAASSVDSRGRIRPEPVTWPAGTIAISGSGVPVTFRAYEVLWGQVDSETITYTDQLGRQQEKDREIVVAQGTFRRRFYAFRYAANMDAYALGSTSPSSVGYQRGARMLERYQVGSVQVESVETEPGLHEYTCSIGDGSQRPLYFQPEVDGGEGANDRPMRGMRTPWVHTVVVRVTSASRRQTLSGLNIRPAIVRATEHVEDPMLAPGPRWSLDLLREALPGCELEDGTAIGDAWTSYLQRYHPVTVDATWVSEQGQAEQWYRRLVGFVWRRNVSLRGAPSERTVSVELQDWTLRLQRPAGVVDARFPPLDLRLFEMARWARAGDRLQVYGSDCVQLILEHALGPEVAGALEVYYPSSGWYSLLDWRVITGDVPMGGLWWPPPFGSSVLDWIRQVCDADLALFFFSGSLQGKNEYVPIYGNYWAVVGSAPTHDLTADDLHPDQPIIGMDVTQISERDINRILVWGRFPGGGQEYRGIIPALGLISAEARIEDGSPIPEQNIARTWERTEVRQGTEYWLPRVAQLVAHLALALYRGVEIARYTVRTRGIANLWWGHKIRLPSSGPAGDPWLSGLAGRELRVMRVTHTYDLQRPWWEAQIVAVPRPATS